LAAPLRFAGRGSTGSSGSSGSSADRVDRCSSVGCFRGKSTGNYGFLMRMFLDLFYLGFFKLPWITIEKYGKNMGRYETIRLVSGRHKKYAKFLPLLMTAMRNKKKTILTKTWC
jgi:hypothetical protein